MEPGLLDFLTCAAAAIAETEFLDAAERECPKDKDATLWRFYRIGELASDVVDSMIKAAFVLNTPDVHLTLTHWLRISFRTEGRLKDVVVLPLSLGQVVLGRTKVLANLPLYRSTSPSDGRFSPILEGIGYPDVRASLLPVFEGERLALRFLTTEETLGLEELGMSRSQVDLLLDCAEKPGLTLISGPAGSGKTTTLYSLLDFLAFDYTHIMTFENPVERTKPAFTQVEIEPFAGISFEQALCSSLRHDVDLLAIGEIRDPGSAKTAVSAALTGRPVMATIHARDCIDAFRRLVDFGVPATLVADVSNCATSQRMVRCVCEHCGGGGCAKCEQTGFSKRTAVFEINPVTDVLRRTLRKGASGTAIR